MRSARIDRQVWQQHAWLNRLQSLALLSFMGGFLALLGWLLWGVEGVLMLLVTGAVGVLLNPSISPRWVMRLYGASRIDAERAPTLTLAIARLAERAQLPATPMLYYVPSRMLNAFAVGNPRQSAIAVTDGLLQRLDLRELVAVLAHEISHIRNNDLWVMGLADMFSRTTSILSLMGQFLLLMNIPLLLIGAATVDWLVVVLLILAPTLSAIAQLALSRTREYDADLNGARLTGDPEGLALALAKIEQLQGGWLERIFLPGRRVPDPSLLRTHPKTADRVDRLMSLGGARDAAGRVVADAVGRGGRVPVGQPVSRAPRWHITGLWH
jgi:heat shock protein HtpX